VALPAELDKAGSEGNVDEALVAFMAAEKGDDKNIASVADQVVQEILRLTSQLGLSSLLSSPRVAVKLLDEIYSCLKSKNELLVVMRAPFGYYKAFEISCKGHPLSELAKTITPTTGAEKEGAEEESEAIKAEKSLESEWVIMAPGEKSAYYGPAEDFPFKKRPNLKKLFKYEESGTRTSDQPPPHIELMRRMELVDYEPGSDPGNFRWYPKGQLIKRLAETYVSNLITQYGGMQVETPIMYDYQHPKLHSYLQRFPARQYVLLSEIVRIDSLFFQTRAIRRARRSETSKDLYHAGPSHLGQGRRTGQRGVCPTG